MTTTGTFKTSFLSKEDIEKISAAVAAAEEQTSGEIVPMIVKRSSMVGHVPMQLLSIWLLLLFSLHTFASQWVYGVISGWIFITIGILGMPLMLWASRLSSVQRSLVPSADQEFEVLERAQLEFTAHKISHTAGRTGILIFISLMEHRCVVLADEGIAAKLPPETWQGIVQQVIRGIKRRQPALGLLSAIDSCGKILAQHFPIQPNDKNELPNALVLKE